MSVMSKEKYFYLYKFRRIGSIEQLERLIEHMEDKVPDENMVFFDSAADHRRAELILMRFFDRVPKHAWRLVR